MHPRCRRRRTKSCKCRNRLGDAGAFDLIDVLGPLGMNIAAHAFLGRDFRGRLGGEFFDCFRDFSGGMDMVSPLWAPLPHLVRSRRARRKLDRIFGGWIRHRREHPADPPGFFQDLLDATFEDGTPIDDALAVNLVLTGGSSGRAGLLSTGRREYCPH